MIEKITQIDRMEVLKDGHIQVREITLFVENGVEVGRGEYHRHVVSPGDDCAKEDAQVQSIASVLHTQAVVDAYKARVTTIAPIK